MNTSSTPGASRVSTEHTIVLAYEIAGPFLCSCGLVLDDAEKGVHHLIEVESEPKATKEAA